MSTAVQNNKKLFLFSVDTKIIIPFIITRPSLLIKGFDRPKKLQKAIGNGYMS